MTLPKGIESAITDRDFTIATIVPSSGSVMEAEDAAAEAEAPADVPADEVPASDATPGDEDKDEAAAS